MDHIDPVEACKNNVVIAARFLEERNYDEVSQAVMKVELAKLDYHLDKHNTEVSYVTQ